MTPFPPDEREAMIAYLEARMDKIKPLIKQGNAFDYRYDETEMILAAIERGDHLSEQGEG